MVMLCEPTVIVPVREGDSLFAATAKPADPFPAPVWPKLMVIQLTFEVAVRAHVPELATMLTVPVPPEIGNDCGAALSMNVQVWALMTPVKRDAETIRTEAPPFKLQMLGDWMPRTISYPASSSSIFFSAGLSRTMRKLRI